MSLETSHGDPIELCVLHQIDPKFEDGKIANFVFGGVSICYGHFADLEPVIKDMIPRNFTPDEIMFEQLLKLLKS